MAIFLRTNLLYREKFAFMITNLTIFGSYLFEFFFGKTLPCKIS